METITWKRPCLFCQRQIVRGRPTLIFSVNEPKLVGVSHSMCSHNAKSYDIFQMCPPHYLSAEHLSFLLHFFPRVYSLPDGPEPDHELRLALCCLIRGFPDSLADIISCLEQALENRKKLSGYTRPYGGDLEADFLRSLAEINKSAKETPGCKVDFR